MGRGIRSPLFVLPHVRLFNVRAVGSDSSHVSCRISDWEGGKWVSGIAFKAADMPLGQALLQGPSDQLFHLVGHIALNHYNGTESAQFKIQDAAQALAPQQAEVA